MKPVINPERLIVALDIPNPHKALMLVQTLLPTGCMFKVGGLLMAVAATSSFRLQSLGIPSGRLMFDPKIWETADSARNIGLHYVCLLRPKFVTVPVPYNFTSMVALYEALSRESPETTLLGVTIPTSMGNVEVQLVSANAFGLAVDAVHHFADLASTIGRVGLVCSATDIAELKASGVYSKFSAIVTPGIRPAGGETNDQKRVATPDQALVAGASHFVIGRPITTAKDPLAAVEAILAA